MSNPDTSSEKSIPTTETGDTLAVRLLDSGIILIGSPDAPVTLTEVLDYGCEYCRDFHLQYFPLLTSTYLRSGKISLTLIYAPLSDASRLAAEAAVCAIEQDAFLPMHEKLLNLQLIDEKSLQSIGKSLKLDMKKWQACRTSAFAKGIVDTHVKLEASRNANRVPAFSIGDDHWIGIVSALELQAKIDAQLHR